MRKVYGITKNKALILDSLRLLKRQALAYGRDLLPRAKRAEWVELPIPTLRAHGYELVVVQLEVNVWTNNHGRRKDSIQE